jgi:tetratricopeptide (TPR) repeat protein
LDALQIRFTEEGTAVPCRVAWPGRPNVDAALLECTGPAPNFEIVRWGRLVASEAGLGCEAAGFPQAMKQDSGLRDVEHMRGKINAGTGLLGGRIYADVSGGKPQLGGWAGMSGAALWCGPLLVGVVAWDLKAFASGRLVAEPVTLLFTDPDFRALIGEGVVVEVVELAGHRPWLSPQTPAYLLRADQAVARFRSRTSELGRLATWCEGEGTRLRLLTGPGGQGKTRLALELATRLGATGDWATAMIPEGMQLPPDVREPLLAVVDYAETRPEQVRQLVLSALSRTGHTPVRLLLLARSAGDWWERLRTSSAELEMALADAIPEELAALEDAPAGRAEAFTEAVQDYRHALQTMGWRCPPADSLTAPDLTQKQFGSPLRLQMSALATLLGGTGSAPEEVILNHEARYWRRTAKEHGLGVNERTLQYAVAFAALCGAADQGEAMAMLACVPGLWDQSEDMRLRAAWWLRDLYPAPADLPGPAELYSGWRPYWGSLQPDLLAEYLVGHVALLDPDSVVQLLASISDTQKYQASTIMDRAADHQPHLVDVWPLLEIIIHDHGDHPSGDAAVRQTLLEPGSTVLALGAPTSGYPASEAHLLHCDVPVGEETISMIPVFTRIEHIIPAVIMNPTWQDLSVLQMESGVVLGDLEAHEWLGINPWSGKEFKLPPQSLPSEAGHDEEEGAGRHAPLSLDPRIASARRRLGKTLRELRDFALDPRRFTLGLDNAGIYEEQGRALAELGRFEEAATAYSQALRVDPHNTAAHEGLGRALAELGRFEEVAAACHEALRVDPDSAIAYNNLGWLHLYVLGDIRAAEQLLDDAVQLDPMFTTAASTNLTAALVAKGDLRSARETVARAVSHEDPPKPKILLWQWLLARAAGAPDAKILTQILAALDQIGTPTGQARFGDMEIRAIALLGSGNATAAQTLRAAASIRTPVNMFFRPMYDLLATPEPPEHFGQLLDVWREIIALDPAAAGPWGSPGV